MQASHLGHVMIDADGRFLDFDGRYRGILGIGRDELPSMTLQQVTHPDDLPLNLTPLRRLVVDDEPFSIRKRYIRPDGCIVRVENHVSKLVGGPSAAGVRLCAVSALASEAPRSFTTTAKQRRALRDEARALCAESRRLRAKLRSARESAAVAQSGAARISGRDATERWVVSQFAASRPRWPRASPTGCGAWRTWSRSWTHARRRPPSAAATGRAPPRPILKDLRMDHGGLGGIKGGRRLDAEDAFEVAVDRALGGRLRSDDAACRAVWSALANVEWTHESGDTASYSFRAAGDLVAAIRGRGDYMDWYCCGPLETVSAEIAAAMAHEGWTHKPLRERPPEEA